MFFSCRYIFIMQPLHYHQIMTKKRALGILVVVWCYSITMGLLPMMGWRVETSTCDRGETYDPLYVLLIFISGCILPVAVTGILFARVIQEARRQSRMIHELEMSLISSQQPSIQRKTSGEGKRVVIVSESGTVSTTPLCSASSPCQPTQPQNNAKQQVVNRKQNKGRQTFRTIVLLMIYFEVSWLPVFISMLLDAFINPRLLPSWTHALFGLMAFANSALDPLIYGYRNRRIRRACGRMIRGWLATMCSKCGVSPVRFHTTDFSSKFDSST